MMIRVKRKYGQKKSLRSPGPFLPVIVFEKVCKAGRFPMDHVRLLTAIRVKTDTFQVSVFP